VFGYAPTPQHGCTSPYSFPNYMNQGNYIDHPMLNFAPDFYTTSNPMSLTRANTSTVSGGAQHVAGPLAGTQGAPVVPQGALQQPAQQNQSMPTLAIPLSQTGSGMLIKLINI